MSSSKAVRCFAKSHRTQHLWQCFQGLWKSRTHPDKMFLPGGGAVLEAARGAQEATRQGPEVGVGYRSDLFCSADLAHRAPRPRPVGSLMSVPAQRAPASPQELSRLQRPSVGPGRGLLALREPSRPYFWSSHPTIPSSGSHQQIESGVQVSLMTLVQGG